MTRWMIQFTLSMSHQEWLEDRCKGIGGLDVVTILGLNQYKLAYQLWLEKICQNELKDIEHEPAYWGNILEEVVAKEFQERTGKKFVVEIKYLNIHSIFFLEQILIEKRLEKMLFLNVKLRINF